MADYTQAKLYLRHNNVPEAMEALRLAVESRMMLDGIELLPQEWEENSSLLIEARHARYGQLKTVEEVADQFGLDWVAISPDDVYDPLTALGKKSGITFKKEFKSFEDLFNEWEGLI